MNREEIEQNVGKRCSLTGKRDLAIIRGLRKYIYDGDGEWRYPCRIVRLTKGGQAVLRDENTGVLLPPVPPTNVELIVMHIEGILRKTATDEFEFQIEHAIWKLSPASLVQLFDDADVKLFKNLRVGAQRLVRINKLEVSE